MNIRRYGRVIKKSLRPFVAKLDTVDDLALRELWMTLLNASERSLQGILYHPPEGIILDTGIDKENIHFWFKKVTLCFIAWIYFGCTKKSRDSINEYVYFRGDTCGGAILNIYEKLFGELPECSNIIKYAAGLKEGDDRGISASGDWEVSMELDVKDYETIGRELLEEIWGIGTAGVTIYKDGKLNKDTIAKLIFLVGGRLWQAHKQIIQPLLFSENTDMGLFKNQFGSKSNNTPKDPSKIEFGKYFYLMKYGEHYAEFLEGVPEKPKVISELFLFRAWTTQFGFRMFSPNGEVSEKVIYEIVNLSNTLGKGMLQAIEEFDIEEILGGTFMGLLQERWQEYDFAFVNNRKEGYIPVKEICFKVCDFCEVEDVAKLLWITQDFLTHFELIKSECAELFYHSSEK